MGMTSARVCELRGFLVGVLSHSDSRRHAAGQSNTVVVLQVRSHAPEVLVLMQCGVSPQGVLAGVTELAALPGWWSLPAVKNGCVYIVDHAPFLRPGPRVVRRFTCAFCRKQMVAE